jgi:hypothetical protein
MKRMWRTGWCLVIGAGCVWPMTFAADRPVSRQGGPFPDELTMADPSGLYIPPPPSIRDFSFIYLDAPPPPELIKIHDIITIEVDEKAEVIVNSRFNRQRNGSITAQLAEFVRL